MRTRLIAVLSFVGCLLTPGVTSAQSATPAASPIAPLCTPDPFCGLAGFQGEGQRTFETFGAGYVIPQVMTFGIVLFATPAQAAASLQTLLVDLRGPQTPKQNVSNMTIASMTPLGDRSKALDGLVTRTDDAGKTVTRVEACFVIQTGAALRFGTAWALEADPLGYAVRAITPSVTRAPSLTPVTIDAFGVASGGLWDALPVIEDIPAGYRLQPGSS